MTFGVALSVLSIASGGAFESKVSRGRFGPVALFLAFSSILLLTALVPSSALATPAPIAAYSFDEGAGGTLSDSAGNHDGTISGATWTSSGKYGSALDFDGTNDLVSIADANDLDLTRTFTLEAWVRPDTLSASSPVIAKDENPGAGISGYLLSAKLSGRPSGYVAASGATKAAAGPSALSTSTWSHLAFTSDGTTLSLYIDGRLVVTQSAIAAAATGASLQIGRDSLLGGYFDGLIDEVRLYGQTLSQGEIQADRDTGIGLAPAPVAAYSFDEGSGATLHDSADDHDGTINGAAAWESPGKYGSALDFDGTNDYVTIPDDVELDFTDAFTLEAWVRPEATGTFKPVITKASYISPTEVTGYQLSVEGTYGRPVGKVAADSAPLAVTGSAALPVDDWSHLALTSDGTTLRLYIDGQLDASASSLITRATGANLMIGAFFGQFFNGLIDEVRLYSQKLNQAEIAADRDTKIDPPQTTITSPQPSYTSSEMWPIEFTSDKAGSTFKCSLDDPNEAPTTTCTSPYSLPTNLSPGWHTFVVAATDSKGTADSTPAKWTFNSAIYPEAPVTSKLTSPEEGERTSHYFTLQAEWGSPPAGGGVTGVTFQVKTWYGNQYRTIPVQYVLDSRGNQVSWPLPVRSNPGKSEPVFFDARAFPNFYNEDTLEDDIKFRAVFDGGVNAAGASRAVTNEFSLRWGPSSDAIETVGPADLDLMTGHYTLSRTDVSIPVPGSDSALEFTRVYHSSYLNGSSLSGLMTGNSHVLGGVWQPSAPVEAAYPGSAWQKIAVRHEDAIPPYIEDGEVLEEEIPGADWVEVLDNGGGGASFDLINGNYVAPEYAREFRLTKVNGNFELVDPDGTKTVFVQNPWVST